MDYKQHKGNLRGQIKNQVERKLYNKRIRAEAIDVDTSEGQLTIPDVIKSGCPACGSKYYDEDNNVKRCQDCYTVFQANCFITVWCMGSLFMDLKMKTK